MSLMADLAQSRLTLEQMLRHTSSLVERRLPRSLDTLDRTLGSGSQLADSVRQELLRGSSSLQGRVERTGSEVDQTLSQLQSTLVDVQALVRDSNGLLRDIRRSWLIRLLEPATPVTPGAADAPAGSP
jgi:ABC-type transporter Mla subunit MlaD